METYTKLSGKPSCISSATCAVYPITQDALAKRTQEHQRRVEAYARNRRMPIEWPDTEPEMSH